MPQSPRQEISNATLQRFATEAFDLWSCMADLWIGYIGDVARSLGPQDLIAANTRLLTNSANVCSAAAGRVMQHAGVEEPILNDA
jgi:hypothetical protein